MYPEDERPDKVAIGCVRNGFFIKSATVLPTGDVQNWVQRLVAAGLGEYGYTVRRAAPWDLDLCRDEFSIPRISLWIEYLYCDNYGQFDALVILSARVESGGKIILNDRYIGHYRTASWTASSAGYQKIINTAMKQCLDGLVTDLAINIRQARLVE